MNPDIWGPHAWIFLHTITLAYPQNPTYVDKSNYKLFFNNLGSILPCDKCKIHYKENLQTFPLTDDILDSKDKLVKWLINIHNNVNKRNNKKMMSYDSVLDKYYHMYKPKSNYMYLVYFVVFILLLIGIKKLLF